MTPPEIPVRPHYSVPWIETVKVGSWVNQPFGNLVKIYPHLADIESRVEILPHHIQITVLVEVSACYFSYQKEVTLTEIGRKLLNRPAEISGLLVGNVLERINPKAIAVCQGDPVFITPG